MPTSYVGNPAGATGERTNPTISEPADGDPGQASTFTPSLQTLADEVAALKQKVAYLDSAAFTAQPTAPTPTTNIVGAGGQPAFGSGWQQANTPANFGFYKDLYGRICLTGTISCTSGSPAATIFTLPAGFIPSSVRRMAVPATNLSPSGSHWVPITALVDTSGNLTIETGPTDSLASLSQIFFDGIYFNP